MHGDLLGAAVLQQLCENHNYKAQTYLHMQSPTRSIDLIGTAAETLRELDALRDLYADCSWLISSQDAGIRQVDENATSAAVTASAGLEKLHEAKKLQREQTCLLS